MPDDLKALYKTVWEISQKVILNMAISRGKYIDQSQSLNIHLSDPNFSKISSMHFHGWKGGLKTGMYYLRSRPAVDAIKFTLNVEELLKATENKDTNEILKAINKYEHSEEIALSKKESSDSVGKENNQLSFNKGSKGQNGTELENNGKSKLKNKEQYFNKKEK